MLNNSESELLAEGYKNGSREDVNETMRGAAEKK
jgi:hypothetical protein